MVDRFERFSFSISEISRYWHKIAGEEMAKYDLKGPYAVYFTTMYRYPEGITPMELSELCSRDKSDVSRALSILEKKELVVKENQSLYKAPLKLTDKGKKLAEKINKKATSAVAYGGRGLSDKDREIFYNALNLISSNLQSLSEKGL